MKNNILRLFRWLPVLFLLLVSINRLTAQVTYDIYVYSLIDGTTVQASVTPGYYEYNPSWSPNGKKLAHDECGYDINGNWYQNIYITEISSHETTPLAGGENGNDAAWSPEGKKIMFDKVTDEWGYSGIFCVPDEGGDPTLLRNYGIMAEWSPNGHYIVFLDEDTWWLKTMHLDDGDETFVVFGAENPDWSPNGQYIVYDEWWCCGGIWIIEVDHAGNPVGDPVQLTSTGGQPTWSNNSKTIYYHDASPDGQYDIYSISVEGGTPELVCGLDIPDYGNYDPCASNNGKYIAFAGATVPGDKSGPAGFQHDAEQESGLLVTVIGNPGAEGFKLNIRSNSPESISLRIIDSEGRVVSDQTGIQPNSMLGIGNGYTPGIYLAEIRQGAQFKVIRLMKQ